MNAWVFAAGRVVQYMWTNRNPPMVLGKRRIKCMLCRFCCWVGMWSKLAIRHFGVNRFWSLQLFDMAGRDCGSDQGWNCMQSGLTVLEAKGGGGGGGARCHGVSNQSCVTCWLVLGGSFSPPS